MTFEIRNPAALGRPRGWNNGMLAPEGGRVLFVAGQIGVEGGAADAAGAARPEPGPGRAEAGAALAAQFGAALARVVSVVEEAGGRPADVGRLTVYVTDMAAYRGSPKEVGAAYRKVFGKHFPAMALVAVAELVDPRAVVEVEATAVIPQARSGGRAASARTSQPETP